MQESFRMHQIGNLLNAYAEKEGGFPENLHELRPFFSGTDEQFHLLVDDGVKLAYAASSGKTFPRLISEAFTTGANTWRIELREPATVVARNQRTNEIRLWFESADAGDPR